VSHSLLRRGGFAIDDYEQIYLLSFCAYLRNDCVLELLLIDVTIPAAALDYAEIIEDLVLELLVLVGIEPSEKIGNAEIDSYLHQTLKTGHKVCVHYLKLVQPAKEVACFSCLLRQLLIFFLQNVSDEVGFIDPPK
jgi:hypothetical protein